MDIIIPHRIGRADPIEQVQKESIVDSLALPDAAEIEFEPERMGETIYRPEDFSS